MECQNHGGDALELVARWTVEHELQAKQYWLDNRQR